MCSVNCHAVIQRQVTYRILSSPKTVLTCSQTIFIPILMSNYFSTAKNHIAVNNIMCDVVVLYDGYSIIKSKEEMRANCSCTLIKGKSNIIIDTMTSWDADKIVSALQLQNLTAEDISYVVSTHGHSDHIGNNNLFLKAKHIVGFSVSYRDTYYIHPFDEGKEYLINENVKVIPTPGHTLSDVTVLVTSVKKEIFAITGDLFEKFEDIEDPSLWLEAGSEDPAQQRLSRLKVAQLADWIVPGHGPQFKVTDEIRKTLKTQLDECIAK